MKESLKPRHESSELLRNISQDVLRISGRPKDYYEIAATLESMGYNDDRIFSDFGYRDIFQISERIFQLILREGLEIDKGKSYFKNSKYTVSQGILDIIRSFLSVCPLLISMFSVFIINFSLWSFMDKTLTSIEQATLIAFAAIASSIFAGGFTQAFLRRGYVLREHSNYKAIWKMHIKSLITGLFGVLIIEAALTILDFFTGIYRLENMLIFDLYFFLLTAMWLIMPIANIIKVELPFAINLIASTGLVYFLKEIQGMNIIYSQAIAMCSFVIINLIVYKVIFIILAAIKKSRDTKSEHKPRLLISIYSLAPYFIYGIMYYVFIFMDRLVAWTANGRTILEPVIRMKGTYDLGMNWGILAILIPSLFIETFFKLLINGDLRAQKEYFVTEGKQYINKIVSRFSTFTVVFFSINVIGAAFSTWIINNIVFFYNIDLSPYFNNTTRMVFYLGIIGYVFITMGLLNNIYLLYFSQGSLILKPLLISIGVNFITGFILSRMFDYYFAVFGFLAGAVSFYILSWFSVQKILKSMDYYSYKNT